MTQNHIKKEARLWFADWGRLIPVHDITKNFFDIFGQSLCNGQSLANIVCGLYLLVVSLLFILSSHRILDFVRNNFSSDFPIIFVYIISLPLFYRSATFFLSDLIALIIFLKCTNLEAPQCVIFSILLSLPITSIPKALCSKTHLVITWCFFDRASWIDYVQGGSNMTGTDLCVNKPH